MHAQTIPISAPPSARRPGPWEGRGGGPYVPGDVVGPPPSPLPAVPLGPYQPPPGAALAQPPVEVDSWTFAALGDYGAGSRPQAQVAATLLERRPDLLLTLGDNTYDFGLEFEYRRRWDPPQFFGRIRENIPTFPSLGNHDVRLGTRAYFRRFPELDKARYYAFERGGVQFVALDSNQSLAPGSTQHQWLASTLADARDAAYRVLYMHHPLHSGRNPGDDSLLRDLAPVLQQGRVDLVLSGHEHHYERTRPLNDYGTVGVTHGGGGKQIHPFKAPPADWSAARRADFGFLEFDVTADALVGRAMLADGSVADTFRVPRRAATDAAAGAAGVGVSARASG